ncbi:MAG: DUF4405 domain-containing protein [Anaerolineae bacterium]|nr:DUF4405 domain-containing protein [Anaerolineae bacterium]
MSRQTRFNWLIDAALFLCALAALLSGIYFLFLPAGFQGGRNIAYSTTIVFERPVWSDLHTWGGVLMIVAAVTHFVYHWQWVTMMSKRVAKAMRGQGTHMSGGAKVNLVVDAAMAVSFLVTAVSGCYFLFVPAGGVHGGRIAGWDPNFLFSRTTWDLIHTWAGVAMIEAAVIHFAIHWRWVTKVTAKFFATLIPRPKPSSPTIPAQ